MDEQVLAARERVLGPDHPGTLTSRNNLAVAYRDAGRTGEAIALHEQILAARERVLGPDHPDTLTSRNNLAVAYQEAGRTGEAITLHEQVLAARERVLGPDHPDTLISRNNLANAYREAGRTGEAIALHEQTLAARERVLGSDHPDTLTSRNNLANAYREAGRTGEAITLHEQTLAARGTRPGPRPPRHPDLAQQPRRRLPGRGPHRRSMKSEPSLQIRSSMCGYPDRFRSVRDLGLVPARCSCESGFPEGCPSGWLPAWLPSRGVHGSGGGRPHLSNLCIVPAWTRSLISAAAETIPRIFRIMDISAVTARTLQGMARVRSGQAPVWPLVSDRGVRSGLQGQA